MTVYADSSFLVSLYLTDQHSEEARRHIFSSSSLLCTPLHLAEWTHAITQHVFRGKISQGEMLKFEGNFDADIGAGLWTRVAMPENAFEVCAALARRYGPKLGVRTLDSLHVACAVELKAERFWTFDERQGKLAKTQGLKTN